MRNLYNTLAAAIVRLIVAYCTPRKRYVDYVHPAPGGGERTYMRRYVLFGYRTGDAPQRGWRAWLPNLYLHHMMAADADTALHDHPWPWGLSFVLLGGYVEERARESAWGWQSRKQAHLTAKWLLDKPKHYPEYQPISRTHAAPALNWIPGSAFHRVAELERVRVCGHGGRCMWRCSGDGAYTLFLAGPRRHNKAWGYLVPGRGYVHQAQRHSELGAKEVRP